MTLLKAWNKTEDSIVEEMIQKRGDPCNHVRKTHVEVECISEFEEVLFT